MLVFVKINNPYIYLFFRSQCLNLQFSNKCAHVAREKYIIAESSYLLSSLPLAYAKNFTKHSHGVAYTV